MTTEEAMAKLDEERPEWQYLPDDLREAIAVINDELDRVTAERDRLIEKWPSWYKGTVYLSSRQKWGVSKGWATFANGDPCFDTREQAVRAAAGLDAREGA